MTDTDKSIQRLYEKWQHRLWIASTSDGCSLSQMDSQELWFLMNYLMGKKNGLQKNLQTNEKNPPKAV